MRQDRMRRSTNVEDRRGMGPAMGSRMGPRMAVGGVGGVGGLILVVVIVLLGGNPLALLGGGGGPAGPGVSGGGRTTAADEASADCVARVLGDTEDVWNELFAQMGRDYQEPTLVLFTGGVDSACGQASSAIGPFYCPGDRTIYIDLAFFDELGTRFDAPGDFAQAYVIAHEVGHHVQNLLGESARVENLRTRASESEANDLSVRLELQADYYAGVWAHHAQASRAILERGDVEEGLAAAAAVGDDRLQRQARGYVVPDSFTHGSSAQRTKWFLAGFDSGDPEGGDTFGVERP